MDGRFRKIDVLNYQFTGGGGIYCNNEHRDLLRSLAKDLFGKPNGNSLRSEESTWKYVLEYQGVFVTLYDFGDFWSQGFLELQNVVPDYEVIYAVSRMLYDHITQLLEAKVETSKKQNVA